MTATYDDALAYLQDRFLTLAQLAEAVGLSEPRLESLIAEGLMPAHSHEATFGLSIYARINGHHPTTDKVVRYYHPDVADLAREADAADRTLGDAAPDAIRVRQAQAVAAASSKPPGPERDALADDAWQVWRDGTVGVCLQRFATTDIVRKSEAVEAMAAALATAAANGAVDRQALAGALTTYAAVAGPFGPHERDGSTRARFYEPALALAAEIDRAAATQAA